MAALLVRALAVNATGGSGASRAAAAAVLGRWGAGYPLVAEALLRTDFAALLLAAAVDPADAALRERGLAALQQLQQNPGLGEHLARRQQELGTASGSFGQRPAEGHCQRELCHPHNAK